MDYDEILLDADDRMQKALEVLRGEFRSMRTGRAHPGLVESVRVEYYGSPTPLKQIASISVPEPDQIVIKPFDGSAMGDIEKGILKSDLGISPVNDGRLIRLKIPALSEERRKQLVGRAKEVAEESRVSMRNVRRDANKHAEQAKKDGSLSEDTLRSLKEEIQETLKKQEKVIDGDLKRKTDELMEI
ncbi:MAG TPA: ribosome recycling factor [Planctomycetes bacterium]|nr:ribosome recycling factor [Planctomycetota bacterium]HIN81127.1 ribosome recycling factor [Planctomycetota bacterium]